MYFLVLILILCLVWYLHLHLKTFSIPFYSFLSLLKSVFLFSNTAITEKIFQQFEQQSGFGKVWLGHETYYLISKPEYLEIILNSPKALEKPTAYRFLKPVLGDGLLTSPAKIWKIHRRTISPSLNQKILNQYPETIAEQCKILIQHLQKHSGQEIEFASYITNCFLDVVGETLFKMPLHVQSANINYDHVINSLMKTAFERIFQFWLQPNVFFNLTKKAKEWHKNVEIINQLTQGIIEKKIEEMKAQSEIGEDTFKPFSDLVVEKYLKNQWSYQELQDEVPTFLLAATDTTSTTSCFVLTLLGMHQAIQQKVYNEVVNVLGPERVPELDDFPKLKYTEMVIKETLRLFPGGAFSGRVAEDDIALGDKIIPKNSNIVIGYLYLHRNEKYWSEPLKFNPDRFLPENAGSRHPYTWIPFSAGSRNCIGMKFGMMAVKILVSMVVRQFKLKSTIEKIEDIEISSNVVLKARHGYHLAFENRL